MYLTQKEPKEGYKYWYLEESKHTEKGTRKSFSMFLGKPERIYDLVQRPLNRLVLSTHNFGILAALLHGVEELRLGEILEEEVTLEGQADMSPA